MRNIDEIIIHCTATRENVPISVEQVRRWHVIENGWSDIGYHFLIGLDGVVHTGRPIKRSGAHVKGHNKTTIGVAYVGGCYVDLNPKDTRTEKQKEAIINLIKDLKVKYTKINKVTGHNVYASKACPCFDAVTEYKDLV